MDDEISHSEAPQTGMTIEESLTRLKSAEDLYQNYLKQVALLQYQLEEASNERLKLQELADMNQKEMDVLREDNNDCLKAKRELQNKSDSDKALIQQLKSDFQVRENEFQEQLNRMKESLQVRRTSSITFEQSRGSISRPSDSKISISTDSGNLVTTPTLRRSNSCHSALATSEKDQIIEGLRIELAEAQLEAIEAETRNGRHTQDLEHSLLQARIMNAKLMEENESVQFLAIEKPSGMPRRSSVRSAHDSLAGAEESGLDATTKDMDGGNDLIQPIPSQIAVLQDENKALTVYINTIVSRLLQYDMDWVLDKNSEPRGPRIPDKDMPPPLPDKDDYLDNLLSKTKSFFGTEKPRQVSLGTVESTPTPTAHEHPDTAPSIPIVRPLARTTSSASRRVADWIPTSAPSMNGLYRGYSPTRNPNSAHINSAGSSPDKSFGVTPRPIRIISGGSVPTIEEEDKLGHDPQRDSKLSNDRHSMASESNGSLSPPQSAVGSTIGDRGPATVMGGSKMRPLRLVQETQSEEDARKAANRASWMGWFNNKVA